MIILDDPNTLQELLQKNYSLGVYSGFDSNYSFDTYAPAYPYNVNFNVTFNIENITCDEFLVKELSNPYFQSVVYVLYTSILLVGLFGNGIVCYIVQSLPRMRTVTNFFIANLAVGDILMASFCIMPSYLSQLILHHWPFGSILCRLVSYSQAVSVLVSAYTLVAISFDRYIAIMFPLRPRISKR